MSEEQKEATVVYSGKQIPMSQLSFQTQRRMARLSALQNDLSNLQDRMAETQLLMKDYSSKVNAALEEAVAKQDEQVLDTSEGKPWEENKEEEAKH